MDKRNIEFYRHNLDQDCLDEINKTANGLFLTTGPKTALFEAEFSKYLDIPFVVGTMSCTHALHLAYRALNIGEGDEVIVPAFTFVATATAVLHAGAKPVFVDVDPSTALLDPDKVIKAITPRTKAICPVHIYGLMAPMDKFADIAKTHNLKLIEDAAHCIEGKGPGFGPGQLSDAVAFSFYATKNITCGEGGALGLKQKEISDSVKTLRNHGLSISALDRFDEGIPFYDVEQVGYKSNMNDLQASLLLPQLKKIDIRHERRVEIIEKYNNAFSSIDGITIPSIPPGYKSAHHLYTIRISASEKRGTFISNLRERGVNCSINYRPLSALTLVRDKLKVKGEDFPNALAIGNSTVTLPLYPLLTDDEVDYVIAAVKDVSKNILQ